MFKPSVTVHKSPDGVLKVLECSVDATVCLEVYKACTEPGEVVYIRKGFTEKRKKIASPPVVKTAVKKSSRKRATAKSLVDPE